MVETWIGLGITIVTFFGAVIGMAVGWATKFTKIEAKTIEICKDLERLESHNKSQHEELFNSRNGMSESIVKLSTLLEVMIAKSDEMDKKLDRLLDRGK